MRQTHVGIIGADRVGLADDRRDSGGVICRKVITSLTTFCPLASMTMLLVSKLTVYQVAFGPGATGGAFEAR